MLDSQIQFTLRRLAQNAGKLADLIGGDDRPRGDAAEIGKHLELVLADAQTAAEALTGEK